MHTLAMAAGERGDRERAHALYEESLVLARGVEDGWLLSAATNNLGGLYLREGNYERAIELVQLHTHGRVQKPQLRNQFLPGRGRFGYIQERRKQIG